MREHPVYTAKTCIPINRNAVSDDVAGVTNALEAVIWPAVRHDCSLITSDADSQIYSNPRAPSGTNRVDLIFCGKTSGNWSAVKVLVVLRGLQM